MSAQRQRDLLHCCIQDRYELVAEIGASHSWELPLTLLRHASALMPHAKSQVLLTNREIWEREG